MGVTPPMGVILSLEPARFLLWATPEGDRVPFEVSKEVTGPLQPRCATSPYCPGERVARISGDPSTSRIRSVVQYEPNPRFAGVHDCPYRFTTKEQCYEDLGRAMLTKALFDTKERVWVANFLASLGYTTSAEAIPSEDIRRGRMLQAHGTTYNFHEIRFEIGPANLGLVLIRNPHDQRYRQP